MTREEAADKLNGNQYREEGSRELFDEMKASGLVAVFGASDDLIELRGAIYDEVGAYAGGEVYVTPAGLFPENECDNVKCPYYERALKTATIIHANRDDDGFSWTYETTIPHSTFIIYEDDDAYCRGIVFALADVPA